MRRTVAVAVACGGAAAVVAITLAGCGSTHSGGRVAQATTTHRSPQPNNSMPPTIDPSRHKAAYKPAKHPHHRTRYVRGAVCSPSQLTMGRTVPLDGNGDFYFSQMFLAQHLRNTGPECRMVLPNYVIFGNAAGISSKIFVYAPDGASHRFPHGASRVLTIEVSWPVFERPEPYCPHPFKHPTEVRLPLAGSALRISVPGIWPPRGVWPEVCRGPKPPPGSDLTRVPVISFTRH
jgi:hypothetical protein